MHPDLWEASIIPENRNTLAFWRDAISTFTDGKYTEEIKTIDYDKDQPKRIVISFDTTKQNQDIPTYSIRQAVETNIPAIDSAFL